MQFGYSNCENCACKNICRYKDDVALFRIDLTNMKYYGEQTWTRRLSPISVELKCNNYIDKTKMHSGEVGE